MNLTYQLPTDMRERLEEEATRLNLDPDKLILSLVKDFLAPGTSMESINEPEAEAERFRLWADSHNRHLPVIPLNKMSREHLYEERG